MRVAVVTVVSGRHDHLRAQRRHLARATPGPDRHVVVAVGDRGVAEVVTDSPLPTTLLQLPATPAGLPVAAARNAGATAALAAGCELLVFLDVDCLPAPDLLERYADAARAHPDALLCGPVTYLPPAPAGGWPVPVPAVERHPHPARPDPPDGQLSALDPDLFWSLSFAVTPTSWLRLGGFYEGYVGYGGEDTDFGRSAANLGTPILMVGRADAFHQHHPTADPPLQHLDDIARNSAIFRRRHGRAPMSGWLDAFREQGLLDPAPGPIRRSDAVRLLTVPARHEYVDAVVPDTVRRVFVDRVTGWEPDPLLDPAALRRHAADVDVVHLHFGYDHLSPAQLTEWLTAVRELGLGLVVTVHDLRNPHHVSRERHDAHLTSLVAAADVVLTLTDAVADRCAERFGRRPRVVAHPTLLTDADASHLPPGTASPAEPADILIPLKALRRNVAEPVPLTAAVVAGAAASGSRVRVLIQPEALRRPEADGLRDLDVSFDVTGHLPHDELCARVARAHACVLPYRFGTHSGWVELCRDLGTHVVAPDCGYFTQQWDAVVPYVNNEAAGLDADSLAAAVKDVCSAPRPLPADRIAREAQRDVVRAEHDALYRAVRRT